MVDEAIQQALDAETEKTYGRTIEILEPLTRPTSGKLLFYQEMKIYALLSRAHQKNSDDKAALPH